MRAPGGQRSCSRCGRISRARSAGIAIVGLAALLLPSSAAAWVSAYLERVESATDVAGDGTATTTLTAWFVVEAGRFEEFKLHGVPLTVAPDFAASAVEDDHGRRYAVELQGKRHPDGILRLRLAAGARIGRGRATCRLVLRENWLSAGYARVQGTTLLVDWTPPIWPDGMERETLRIAFVSPGGPLEFSVPEGLVPELEPHVAGRAITLSRFRPAAMYAMPVRFEVQPPEGNAALPVAALASSGTAPQRTHRSRPPAAREHADTLPFLAALPALGAVLLALRVRHARRVAPAAGGVQPHLLLPALGAPLRWPIVAGALAAGAWLLFAGELLAGFAVQAAAVLLALPDRFRWLDGPRAGHGPWRSLAAPSPRTWRSLAAATRRARRSWLDVTGPTGLSLLLLAGGAVVAAMNYALGTDVQAWIVVGADAVLLLLPPFLVASARALPPVLPGEAGVALERVRRDVLRRGKDDGFEVSFLVQDDGAAGPADVRMRVRRPAARIARSAVVAVEWGLTRWGWHPTYAVLLDLPAGSRLRAGAAGFPRQARCRLAGDLGRETWTIRAPTGRSAAGILLRTMQRAEALLAPAAAQPADDEPSAADEPSSASEALAVVRGHGPHPATAPEIRPAP